MELRSSVIPVLDRKTFQKQNFLYCREVCQERRCKALTELLTASFEAGKKLAAICAAPSVLGDLGILKGKKACCYPGFEEHLTGAQVVFDQVAQDGNVTTSRGMGTAIPFALSLVSQMVSKEKAQELAQSIIFKV